MSSFPVKISFPTHVYHSDRDCYNKLCGGGVLTAVSDTVFCVKRRSDLEFFQEWVWIEITLSGGRDMLIRIHDFAPDIKVDVINNYLIFFRKYFRYRKVSCTFAFTPLLPLY
jgi:hypothetical protein